MARMTEADFWAARPWLTEVRDYALDQAVSPWALLGGLMARQLASVPPTVGTESRSARPGTLNLLIALVGQSGDGKSESFELSGDVLPPGDDYYTALPGTGEGMAEMYLAREKVDGEWVVRQRHDRALLYVDEVGQLEALMSRSGSSLGSTLRTMWSAGAIGADNAKRDNSRRVGAGSYRFVGVVGVQPRLSRVLIEDNGAGTPQRFLWLPATHRDIKDWKFARLALPRVTVTIPPAGTVLAVDQKIWNAIDRRKRERTYAGTLDAHRDWQTLRVAAALALLDGRDAVTPDMWRLASFVMKVSAKTRDACQDAITEALRDEGKRRGHIAAAQAETVAQHHKVRDNARAKVIKVLEDGQWHPSREITQGLTQPQRRFASAVLSDLVDEGVIHHDTRQRRGNSGDYYQLV